MLMKKKLIIDTDPGVDDAMAILAAFNSPEVEVVALTTIFGNVRTQQATSNALRLVEMAGLTIPVIEGSRTAMKDDNQHIADFVHGTDGFGNTNQPEPKGAAMHKVSAAEFIVRACCESPGEVSILALGPLTNIAMALMLDPQLGSKWAELVVLGGAFFVNGNVNPAAEANIYADADAADFVFRAAENIKVAGLDVSECCRLSASELAAFKGVGRYGTFVSSITQFYLQFHREQYSMEGIFLHDPAALCAVLAPELFTWHCGAVRVVSEGVAKGHTIMDACTKTWKYSNPWVDRPKIQVATHVDSEAVARLVKERLSL